jgi:hypothetical protein
MEKHLEVATRPLRLSALTRLAARAGDASKPVAVQEIAPAQAAAMRVFNVTAENATGRRHSVLRARARIVAEVTAAVAGLAPAGAAGAPTARIRLVFTQHDKGNAFARAMLIGLGQIKIDADAYFVDDATDLPPGKYQVSKRGICGGSTSLEDVE